MSVRVLVNGLSLAATGGSRSYLRNLLREVARIDRGLSFHVAVARGRLSVEEAAGLPLIEVDLPNAHGAGALARVAFEQAWLPRAARDFDVLYCPADVAPAFARTPTVVALRNLNIYDRRFYDTPRTRLLFHLVRWGVRRSAVHVVTPTLAAAEAIGPLVGIAADRFTVVPHGIDLEAFDSMPLAHGGATTRPPYVFVPANLERHKNLEIVFEALRLVDPRLEFWIAGGRDLDPEWARHLEAETHRLAVAHRVRFLGAVPYARVLSYYRSAVALVFPSLLETFGHPLLEAMLASTPILASDLPSFREIAGGAARYFDPTDAADVARAIEEVQHGGDEVARRVEIGTRRVEELSWARSVDALCAVLRSACGAPPPTPAAPPVAGTR